MRYHGFNLEKSLLFDWDRASERAMQRALIVPKKGVLVFINLEKLFYTILLQKSSVFFFYKNALKI